MWLWYYVREMSIRTLNRVYWENSRLDEVEMLCLVCEEERELTRYRRRTADKAHHCGHTWMMEWTYSNRPASGTSKACKKVSSGLEPEKYWVDRMFTPNHKIIPNNKFIYFYKKQNGLPNYEIMNFNYQQILETFKLKNWEKTQL